MRNIESAFVPFNRRRPAFIAHSRPNPCFLEWTQVEALAVVVPADQKTFSSSAGRDLHPIPAFIAMDPWLPILRRVETVQSPAAVEQNVREPGAGLLL